MCLLIQYIDDIQYVISIIRPFAHDTVIDSRYAFCGKVDVIYAQISILRGFPLSRQSLDCVWP
jgi:hypothetical protein